MEEKDVPTGGSGLLILLLVLLLGSILLLIAGVVFIAIGDGRLGAPSQALATNAYTLAFWFLAIGIILLVAVIIAFIASSSDDSEEDPD